MSNLDIDMVLHDLYAKHECVMTSFRQSSREVELKFHSRRHGKTFTVRHFSFSKALERIAKEVIDFDFKAFELAQHS